ncbi:MAG: tyrosine-type recombinase/integrase [Candidatus Limnocylindrales bacterium]
MPKRTLPQPLEPEELRAVINRTNPRVPTGLRNRTILLVMATIGLRVGEIVSLKMADLSRKRDRLRIIDGKGGDRYIPIPDALRLQLEAWLAERARIAPKSPWVFCQVRSTTWRDPAAETGAKLAGSAISTAYLRELCARLGREAGVERATNPHVFRHTAATGLLDAGYTLAEVQTILGHANIATTSVYLHVAQGRLAEKLRSYDAMAER